MKCDENQPVCSNCAVVGRTCRYAHLDPHSAPSTPAACRGPSSAASPSPVDPSDDARAQASSGAGIQPDVARFFGDVEHHPTGAPARGDDEASAVDMNHMELLVHSHRAVYWPSQDERLTFLGMTLLWDASLDAPYLLHQVLALSSRRLAAQRPARADFYLHQAVRLQNRAIALFNQSHLQVDRSNCAAMLLFSSLLGQHMLADTLAHATSSRCAAPDQLASFLDRWVQYVRVHRGVRAIASSAWPLLLQSDLQPFIALGGGLMDRASRGRELDHLRDLLSRDRTRSQIGEAAQQTCLEALHFLQLGIDDLSDGDGDDRNHEDRNNDTNNEGDGSKATVSHQMVFHWAVVSPVEFASLLRDRVPQALVVLAHFGGLLHCARSLWQVGDAGAHLVRGIADFLGPAWEPWLRWPNSILCSST
ncbi:hypothetical protein VTK73DRAFT_2833 [Phialemonium thermophilum]|uniref:Zn(2)-C6 fungal-type domain-containing protein n=1 Tax=Phialemonium thermophilum TaxID=223376 RepID=A0ABR3VNL4_9PEZI